jgi:hypothetical protein
LQRAALQLLEHTAEWDKTNFSNFLSLTFPPVVALLSSPDVDVLWAALRVLKFYINSFLDIKSALSNVVQHLSSPEPDIQLAALEVLHSSVQSSRRDILEAAILEPILIDLLSSPVTAVQVAARSIQNALHGAIPAIAPRPALNGELPGSASSTSLLL